VLTVDNRADDLTGASKSYDNESFTVEGKNGAALGDNEESFKVEG
jgi:hypothetical protein